MNLVTWDPFRDLTMLQGDVNRLFDRFGGTGDARRPWSPALDVHEEADRFVVRCDLPGMTERDVEIEVENRVLRIAGERRSEATGKGDGYRRIERSFGRFERMLTLPAGVDPETIEAAFEHGVLELRVPKPEQVKPRRIPIGGSARDTLEGAAPDEGAELTVERSSGERELAHA